MATPVTIHEGKGNGREVRVDLSQAEQLCHLGCTLREVAGFFKCSEDTIQRLLKRERDQTFTEFYNMHSAGGDISLRRAQYDRAVNKGDAKLLIWLGKQRLGQTDKQEVSHKGELAVTTSSLLGLLSLDDKRKLLEAKRAARAQEGTANG